MGRERRRRTSDKSEQNGRGSSVVLDWSISGMEIKNCNPVEGEEATSWVVAVGLLKGCKVEAGVSSGEAGVEGIFEGEEREEREK